MKKFVYLFLFILLYSCASSYSGRQAEQQNKIFIGQSKFSFCYDNMAGGALLGESICFFSLRNRNNSYLYYLAGGNEVLSTNDGRFYLFKDVYFSPLRMISICKIVKKILLNDFGKTGIYNLGSKNGLSKLKFSLIFSNYLKIKLINLVSNSIYSLIQN